MDRVANLLFVCVLIAVLAGMPGRAVTIHIIFGGIASAAVGLWSLHRGWLSRGGAVSAGITGAIAFGLGGWAAAVILLFFALGSFLITLAQPKSGEKREWTTDSDLDEDESEGHRMRRAAQVWSNGFWFSLWITVAFLFDNTIYLAASAAAMATATSDTWATELGSRRFGGATWLITCMKRVKPGTDGGISLAGTLAAAAGSAAVGGLSVLVFPLPARFFFIIFAAGFLGSLADSYFGAAFQRKQVSLRLPWKAERPDPDIEVDNNMVNWVSTGMGSFIPIIIKLLQI